MRSFCELAHNRALGPWWGGRGVVQWRLLHKDSPEFAAPANMLHSQALVLVRCPSLKPGVGVDDICVWRDDVCHSF